MCDHVRYRHADLLGLGQRADARGAQALGDNFALFHHIDFLHIDIPAAAGCFA